MARPVLQQISQNTNKSVINPYKQKPTYIDNRHTWVPERDIRPHDDVRFIPPHNPAFPQGQGWPFYRSPVLIHAPRDEVLGHLGGAEIDFGNGDKKPAAANDDSSKTSDKKHADV